ncbi:SDR family NAD(P)-dependent oxidoreductase [Pseudochelatococcus sp. G4_1912]|uniref:SDR family NAD(P)-dependent oxidoreductase n=1 Tax=Pseudochelatococcus sp. G4_1912 TaxID=3114288 RepID=UPI0039C71287
MGVLANRTAFVTGGSGGLGAAICAALAQAGARVGVGYVTAPKAHAFVAQLPGSGHRAIHAPVNDTSALNQAAEEVRESFGGLDLLVNCAGITRFVPHDDLDALDDALIDEILTVNVRGVIATTRAFVPLLRKGTDSLIVNISSIAGTTAMGSNIAYCASKAAVDNLTKSLGRALAPKIRVVSIAPGLVDTDFVKSLDQDWRDDQARRTPLQRLADPQEIAQAVIASAVALTFMTGVVIPVDGGRPLG